MPLDPVLFRISMHGILKINKSIEFAVSRS